MSSPCRLALFLILLLPLWPAQAVVYCVHDVTELTTALDAAGDNQQDDEIRIRSGDYAAPVGIPFIASVTDARSLHISGGWSGSNGACSTRIENATATELRRTDSGNGRIFYIAGGSAAGATITLSNLLLFNGQSISGFAGGCLFMGSSGQPLRVERVIALGCRATSADGGGMYLSGPQLTVTGSLFRGGQANRGGGLYLQVNGSNGVANVVNNTFFGNAALQSGQGSGLQILTSAGAQANLANNILWNNDAQSGRADLNIEAGSLAVSSFDHIDRYSGSFAIPPIGTTSGDPAFQSTATPIPRQESVCRDSGLATPPGGAPTVDLLGKARPQGAGLDRGAYEFVPPDSIFADGFSPP